MWALAVASAGTTGDRRPPLTCTPTRLVAQAVGADRAAAGEGERAAADRADAATGGRGGSHDGPRSPQIVRRRSVSGPQPQATADGIPAGQRRRPLGADTCQLREGSSGSSIRASRARSTRSPLPARGVSELAAVCCAVGAIVSLVGGELVMGQACQGAGGVSAGDREPVRCSWDVQGRPRG